MISYLKNNSFFLSKSFQSLIFSRSFAQYSVHIRALIFSWLAFEITQKDIWVGIVLGAGSSPIFITSFLGSFLSEKYNINKILFISYLLFFLALIFMIFIDYDNIYILLILSVTFGAIPGIWQTVFQTILVNTNTKKNLSKINSYYYLIIFFGEMMNPIIFAYLITSFSINYVIVFASIYLVFSIILVNFHPKDLQEKRKNNYINYDSYQDILKNKPVIFWAVIIAAFQSIFGVTLFVVLPKYANILDVGATGFGIMNASVGAGMFFGSMLSIFTGVFRSRITIWIISSLGWDIGQLLFAFSENYIFSLLCLFLMGISGAYWMVAATLIFQDQTEKFDRNKIMGLFSLVLSIFFIGWFVGGVISDITNAKIAIIISAVSVYPVIIIGLSLSKKLRRV